jgi:hypothetical protein
LSIGVPSFEHPERQSAVLRGYLKVVVYTINKIKESIAEAQADTKRDTTSIIEQLKINQAHIIEWGKTLQENIRLLEGSR